MTGRSPFFFYPQNFEERHDNPYADHAWSIETRYTCGRFACPSGFYANSLTHLHIFLKGDIVTADSFALNEERRLISMQIQTEAIHGIQDAVHDICDDILG